MAARVIISSRIEETDFEVYYFFLYIYITFSCFKSLIRLTSQRKVRRCYSAVQLNIFFFSKEPKIISSDCSKQN